MSRAIHRYPSDHSKINTGEFIIPMPIGTAVVSFQIEAHELCIYGDSYWKDDPITWIDRRFAIYKVKDDLPNIPIRYIGSVHTPAGYTWHLYEHTTPLLKDDKTPA